MNTAFRALLVSALLLPACDGGDKAKDAPAASASGAAAATGKVAEAPKDDAANPGAPKPGQAILPGQPGYDCGRLLSKIEIESICGVKLQPVVLDRNEGKREQVRCSRRWRNDTKSRTVSLILGDYGSAEKAKSLSAPDDAKTYPDVGDLGRGYIEDKTNGIFWHTMRTAKGQYNLDIRSIITDGGEPLCTLDQLSELSAEVAKRIEQIPPAQ